MPLAFKNEIVMERYLIDSRPLEEISNQVHLNYKIEQQSIIVFEISPVWNNPVARI